MSWLETRTSYLGVTGAEVRPTLRTSHPKLYPVARPNETERPWTLASVTTDQLGADRALPC